MSKLIYLFDVKGRRFLTGQPFVGKPWHGILKGVLFSCRENIVESERHFFLDAEVGVFAGLLVLRIDVVGVRRLAKHEIVSGRQSGSHDGGQEQLVDVLGVESGRRHVVRKVTRPLSEHGHVQQLFRVQQKVERVRHAHRADRNDRRVEPRGRPDEIDLFGPEQLVALVAPVEDLPDPTREEQRVLSRLHQPVKVSRGHHDRTKLLEVLHIGKVVAGSVLGHGWFLDSGDASQFPAFSEPAARTGWTSLKYDRVREAPDGDPVLVQFCDQEAEIRSQELVVGHKEYRSLARNVPDPEGTLPRLVRAEPDRTEVVL
mmetsp:Transcript_23674/g.55738  ORF Transcript_23674/g.55738 Transcript_23674/m.55738 type:complete len:315 (+) Transcript_23674:1124-2068(+)